jgi:hypothetical protein
MDPEKVIENLFKELDKSLKAMGKAKTIEEKETYSRIIKNLAESSGVFFSAINDMMAYSTDNLDDLDDIDIDEDF